MSGPGSKLRILYLMKILLNETDEEHSLTMSQMIEALKAYGISAERKSIYDDIENLQVFGIDIIGEKANKTYSYHIGSKQFELAELKLLVDSIQASKFITAKKSQELIRKMTDCASRYEASQLKRQIYVAKRNKAENESIYYNVDRIHQAINANTQIRFHYFNYDVNKKRILKKAGQFYQVSPWALSWDDEKYYLVAFDSEEDLIKHFRVDKMLDLEVTGERREGRQHFHQFDMGAYAKKMFGMFNGEEELVKIECRNELAGVMLDRFGRDLSIIKKDEEHFCINVRVAVSRQFLAWVMALGEGAKIVGPEPVVQMLNQELDRLVRQYKER